MLPGSHVVRLVLALFGCILLPGASVHACSPAPPMVTEHLTVGQAALPPGITVRATDSQTIMLANRSALALYVIGTLEGEGTAHEQFPAALPPGTGPVHKLIDGQVFSWRPLRVAPDQPAVLAWNEDRYRRDGLPIAVWPDHIGADRGPLAAVARRYPTGDLGPATMALPAPQQTELTLVYGEQRLTVPLTLSYVRNQPAATACDTRQWFTWALLLGLGGAALLVVATGLRRLRRG